MAATDAIPVLTGLVAGLLIAVLGGGGGLFLVPVLTAGLGVSVAEASGASLGAVALSAVAALPGHARKKLVRFRQAGLFGLASFPAAQVGAQLHRFIPGRWALLGFAALLVYSGVRMLRAKPPAPSAPPPRPTWWKVVAGGALVGLLAGFFGIGGGFLSVPVLAVGLALPMPEAVATSVAAIALTSLGGAIGHLWAGTLPVALTLKVGGGALVGAFAGGLLAGRIPARPLRVAFVALLGVALLVTLWKAWAL